MTTLDKRSRTLLEECIRTQGIEKTSISKSALHLEELSFIIIRDFSNVFEKKFLLSPTLIGEEYMDEVWRNEDNG